MRCLSLFITLKSRNWLEEKPETQEIHFLLYLPPRSSSFPKLFILIGVTWKGITPFAGMEGKDLATSAERLTAACHTLARMNDFHPLAPSHSDTHTVKPGERGAHRHTYSHISYIYKQWKHRLYIFNPALWPNVATTYFFVSLSHSVSLSQTPITVILDFYSLLRLSLVSLSRNRTRGAGDPRVLVGDLMWNLSSANLMELCVWGGVGWSVCGGPWGVMLAAYVTTWKAGLVKTSFKWITLLCCVRLNSDASSKLKYITRVMLFLAIIIMYCYFFTCFCRDSHPSSPCAFPPLDILVYWWKTAKTERNYYSYWRIIIHHSLL